MPIEVLEEPKAPCTDLPETTDAALVAAAKSGDRSAFDALVSRHQRRILFAALRITRNREDAEDVVQQSFQNAFIHLPEFEGRSSFSTWLTRIAFNEALMLKRSSRKSREVSLDESHPDDETKAVMEIADAGPTPESGFSRHEQSRLLLSAMNSLKPGIRSAIEVCDLDEKSARETAMALGLSVSAVKSRVNRGRRALRDKLQRHILPVTIRQRSATRRAAQGVFRNLAPVRIRVSFSR
ncbi:MAG TPA: sigma-70 family RNA polymerase sigma factor [Candidatus Acidoferrales bacterium]|nr:sigma-70 family RNA polymerase sigma factor [Candidatus Acidoferrales bacterium]